jgi:hypothetical protein
VDVVEVLIDDVQAVEAEIEAAAVEPLGHEDVFVRARPGDQQPLHRLDELRGGVHGQACTPR